MPRDFRLVFFMNQFPPSPWHRWHRWQMEKSSIRKSLIILFGHLWLVELTNKKSRDTVPLKAEEDVLDVLYKLTSEKCVEYFGCGRALPVTPHSLSLFARQLACEKFKACAATTYGSHRLGTAPPNRPPKQWAWALVTLSNLHRGIGQGIYK